MAEIGSYGHDPFRMLVSALGLLVIGYGGQLNAADEMLHDLEVIFKKPVFVGVDIGEGHPPGFAGIVTTLNGW